MSLKRKWIFLLTHMAFLEDEWSHLEYFENREMCLRVGTLRTCFRRPCLDSTLHQSLFTSIIIITWKSLDHSCLNIYFFSAVHFPPKPPQVIDSTKVKSFLIFSPDVCTCGHANENIESVASHIWATKQRLALQICLGGKKFDASIANWRQLFDIYTDFK